MTFGRLLGGAGGSGEACRTLQILQSMVSRSHHALLPPCGVRRIVLRATPSAAGPFWLLGVAIWGSRCLYFDILGNHFSTSGTPWGGMLAPRDRPGGPWEQQDGLEMVGYRILFDFGMILGPVYISQKRGSIGACRPGFRRGDKKPTRKPNFATFGPIIYYI